MTHRDFVQKSDLSICDPDVDELIRLEGERQARKIIMIPSESFAPLAVRQARPGSGR